MTTILEFIALGVGIATVYIVGKPLVKWFLRKLLEVYMRRLSPLERIKFRLRCRGFDL